MKDYCANCYKEKNCKEIILSFSRINITLSVCESCWNRLRKIIPNKNNFKLVEGVEE